jgi:acetyl esterase/lipase
MALPEHFKRYAIERILKLSCKIPSQYHLSPSILRQSMTIASKSFPVRPEVNIKQVRLGNFPAEQHVLYTNGLSKKVVLHIHGGVFFLGGPDTHRALASQIAAQTGATVFVLDYPLSPEHIYPSAVNAIKDAYMALIQAGYDAKDIVISGDSCGGNLALATVIALRDAKIMLPSAMILMSPFLDLTLSGKSMQMNKKLDAMLTPELLAQGSQYYVGDYPLQHPLVSPLFADLSGLPPTLVQVGSKEVLLDDANRFKALAEAVNSPVELNIYPGMWHVFQMFSPWVSMAEQSIIELRDFMQRHA